MGSRPSEVAAASLQKTGNKANIPLPPRPRAGPASQVQTWRKRVVLLFLSPFPARSGDLDLDVTWLDYRQGISKEPCQGPRNRSRQLQ